MRILIEEYQYSLTDELRQHDLKCILKEVGGFENVEGKISVPWERFSETQPVVPNLMGKPPLTLFFPYGISAEPGKSEKKAKNAG